MKNFAKLSIALLLGTASFTGVSPLVKIAKREVDGGVSKSYFRYAASNIPEDDKKEKGGEDAYLASNNLLVVADGVSSWSKKGIDSGIYSKSLVAAIK